MNQSLPFTFRDKLLFLVGMVALIPVVAFSLGTWLFGYYLFQGLQHQPSLMILTKHMSAFWKIILQVLAVSAIVGILAGFLLARRLSRKIEDLSKGANAWDRGELDYRITANYQDEIGILAQTLNQMADKLQDNMISRSAWENTFNAIPDLIFLLDAQGHITALNQAAANFLHLPASKVRGLHFKDLGRHCHHPPPFTTYHEMLAAQGRRESEWSDDLTGQTWLTVTYPRRDQENSIIGGVHVIRNITVLKQAQAELAQTTRFLHEILEAAPLTISVVDQRGFFQYLSPQVQKEFGYTPAQLLGQHYSLLYDSESEKQKVINELQEHGLVQSLRVVLRHEDGHPCAARLSIRKLVDQQGQVKGSVALSRNVELEENLQRQVEQSQKMESLATMAGGLAHNFNNLLMIILGLANLIKAQLDQGGPGATELQEIISQVEAGSELTRQLLALAREAPLEMQPLHLNRLVAQVGDLFARTHREISLKTDLTSGHTFIEADPSQIQQVLMNLLLNAWQSMPESGEIHLKTVVRRFEDGDSLPFALKPGNYVCLTIQDTGVGMDEATLKHIFEPFFTTKGKEEGSGLGLTTVYNIIKKHQGIIRVESKKGQGTAFHLYFPQCLKAMEEFNPRNHPVVHGHGTILLVDDEPVLRKVAARLLERLGYEVLQAPDGSQALEIFQAQRQGIDLVILDVIMPGLSGYQTYQQLKGLDAGVKVLFSSGYAETDTIQGLEATPFIQKPYTVEALSQKVALLLNNQTLQS